MKISELQALFDDAVADLDADIKRGIELIEAGVAVIQGAITTTDNPAVQHMADQIAEVKGELQGAFHDALNKLADVLPHPVEAPTQATSPDVPAAAPPVA